MSGEGRGGKGNGQGKEEGGEFSVFECTCEISYLLPVSC